MKGTWIGTTAALAMALTQATAAHAQDDDGKWEVGLRLDSWIVDGDFESRTATVTEKISASSVTGLEVFGRYHLMDPWTIQAGVGFSFDSDIDLLVLSAGARYRLDIMPPGPWSFDVIGSALFGTVDLGDALGDFDFAFGIEAGAGVTLELGTVMKGLSVGADAMLRFLEFDFDPDSGVVDSDDAFGGFGVRVLVGASLRF